MTDRLTEAFDALFRHMEDPPTWDQVRSQRLSPTRGPYPKPGWLVFAAGFALVLVVGVAAGLLTNVGGVAEATVPHVRLTWTTQVTLRCEGMEPVDNGGFDSATIDIWGPTSNGMYRIDATAPDGAVELLMVEEPEFGRPVRAWSTAGLGPGSGSLFRSAECSDPERSASYQMARPPLDSGGVFPLGFTPIPIQDADGNPIDLAYMFLGTRRQDRWHGETVTVFSATSTSEDELGILSSTQERWVDLDERRVVRDISDLDQEVTGRTIVTMEALEHNEVALSDVSFSTDGLPLSLDRTQVRNSKPPVTTTSIAPTQVPLMADATEISPGGIPTQDLGDVIDPQPGDQLYTVPVGRFAIFVRLRAGTRPHMYATSCDVLAEAELPQGWEGTCLERTVNGKREHGVFPYGTTSE